MSTKPRIALVGIGGYGHRYVQASLENTGNREFEIAAAIDPMPEKCTSLDELKARNVPIFASLEEALDKERVDLCVLSSPIHLHAPQTCLALSKGANVLSEKPLCSTVQESDEMIRARDEAGRNVSVGYQWSYSDAILKLKGDILAGRYGKPVNLKTMVMWPRKKTYYDRSPWAGAKKTPQGAWVLDSPANNATAHYLHNMFYVLGPDMRTSAVPVEVQAEMYRAHPITNYDTGTVRTLTDTGVEIMFFSTHATNEQVGPVCEYVFEDATVKFTPQDNFSVHFNNGEVEEIGNPNLNVDRKLWNSLDAIENAEAHTLSIEAARSQTLCVNAMQRSFGEPADFPRDLVQVDKSDDDQQTHVPEIPEVFGRCFSEGQLPSELGLAWAKSGEKISLEGFTFPTSEDE